MNSGPRVNVPPGNLMFQWKNMQIRKIYPDFGWFGGALCSSVSHGEGFIPMHGADGLALANPNILGLAANQAPLWIFFPTLRQDILQICAQKKWKTNRDTLVLRSGNSGSFLEN